MHAASFFLLYTLSAFVIAAPRSTESMILNHLTSLQRRVWFGLVSFKPITQLSDVPASGDQYPTRLPTPSNPTAFLGRRVLFVLSHGVEDHEVYYQHQYFLDRGANVSFSCPPGVKQAVLSDFFKPSYLVDCAQDYDVVDLFSFDGVFVPGGLPSSSEVRVSAMPAKLRAYWLQGGPQKLLAFICSGTENLIDSGILAQTDSVVGSPASKWSLWLGLDAVNHPRQYYEGLNDQVNAIPYPSTSQHAQLVLGKNPNASPWFVTAIGQVWIGLNETVPESSVDGVPLRVDSSGVYENIQFYSVSSLSDLPQVVVPTPLPALPSVPSLANKTVTLLVSSGADNASTTFLASYFQSQGSIVSIACPGWVITWKQATVYLFSQPPVLPTLAVHCDMQLSDAIASDILVVPSGLFSTHSVLRNEDDILALLTAVYTNGSKTVALYGSGTILASLPFDTQTRLSVAVPADSYSLADVGHANRDVVVVDDTNVQKATATSARVVIGRGDLAEFISAIVPKQSLIVS